MGGVYINTTHFYFYRMIKNKIKKHIFVEDKTNYGFGDILFNNTTTAWVTGIDPAYIDQNYTFTIHNGTSTTLRVDNTGNIMANGILHALGSVIYNTETNRLNYWDGDQWIEINQ